MSEAVASPSNGHVPGAALRLLGDDRLARRAAHGDREAFAVLYRRHHQALYRYCRAILGNGEDAADALQNTMAAALRSLPGDDREIRVKPWLYRIAHNESVSLLRRRAPHADLEAAGDVAAVPDSDPETRERLRQLVTDLHELQDRQRTALVMRELNGLAYEEIAATLDASPAATKQLVYEARTALHEMAEGRDMTCESVRRSLSAQDRRLLRGRKLRAHMRECAGCREFKDLMSVRQRDLAAMTPALPALAAASVLQGIIGGGTQGGGGLLAGLASSVAGTTAVTKGAATVAVVATVGAGTAGVTGNLPTPLESKRTPGAATSAPARTPGVIARPNTKPVSRPARQRGRPPVIPGHRSGRTRPAAPGLAGNPRVRPDRGKSQPPKPIAGRGRSLSPGPTRKKPAGAQPHPPNASKPRPPAPVRKTPSVPAKKVPPALATPTPEP